jgi:hypothetical protein
MARKPMKPKPKPRRPAVRRTPPPPITTGPRSIDAPARSEEILGATHAAAHKAPQIEPPTPHVPGAAHEKARGSASE